MDWHDKLALWKAYNISILNKNLLAKIACIPEKSMPILNRYILICTLLRIMVFILLNFYFITMVLDPSHDLLSCDS